MLHCSKTNSFILPFLVIGFVLLGITTSSHAFRSHRVKPHVVFLVGDDEYRSEESMPMIARILKERYNCKVTLCYSMGKEGFIAPSNHDNITGIKALDNADLMVLFTRFRDLPDEQFKHFLKYVESGMPIVGFRTSTHAFKFDKHPHHKEWGWRGEKIAQLVGQNWITHHGHFKDGKQPLTDVTIIDKMKTHPILRGVKPFQAYSWLYHVQGGGDKLRGDSKPLMMGRSLISNHEKKGNLKRYPLNNPTAWTKTYQGKNGTVGRVFFTTTAHSYDFKNESVRKLAVNGILWALSLENDIPKEGANVKVIGNYNPNNSGMNKFKKGLKPPKI